jgi:hypothetical protein
LRSDGLRLTATTETCSAKSPDFAVTMQAVPDCFICDYPVQKASEDI